MWEKEPKHTTANWVVGKEKPQAMKKYQVEIKVCEMHDDLPHEMLKAYLKANKPFTKQAIDEFIASDQTIQNMEKIAKAHDVEIKIFAFITQM